MGIRRAAEADWEACARLVRRCFAYAVNDWGVTPENAPGNGAFETAERLREGAERGKRGYVWEKNGVISGFVMLSEAGEGAFELEKLCVLPERQGEGAGRRLLAYAFDEAVALGGHTLRAGVIAENAPLVRWYEANGFRLTRTAKLGRLPFTVGIMERELPDPMALAKRVCAYCERELGENLVGFYVHGSLCLGDFHWARSDVDFLIVVRDALSLEQKRGLIRELLDADGDAPRKGLEMSVVTERACRTGAQPAPFDLHFSNAHKQAFKEDLDGTIERMRGADWDLATHFDLTRAKGIALHGPAPEALFAKVPEAAFWESIRRDLSEAEECDDDNAAYYLLNACRTLARKQEGRVLSKGQGGEWALSRFGEDMDALIRAAADEYECGEPAHLSGEVVRGFVGEAMRSSGM